MDNAALIFPAVMRRNWSNAFRLSVTLNAPVDAACLARAVRDVAPRFPTFFVRLRRGFFWYYLEQTASPAPVQQDYAYPLTHMSRRQLRRSCVRILYFENRIAAEFFHSVTDGSGGSVFLQTLTARYVELAFGETVPPGGGVLRLSDEPGEEELRDAFLLCGGRYAMTRREEDPYKLRGRPEPDRFRHLTTGVMPTDALLTAAHRFGATATVFLAAVMAEAVAGIQAAERSPRRLRPVKITLPVNLRRIFGLSTLRNFVLTLNLGFDPRLGDFTLAEICAQIAHGLAAEAVPQKMAARVAANVNPQKNRLIRCMPRIVKTAVLRAIYDLSGERKGCLNLSNLGQIDLPEEMARHVERFEFIIGVQRTYPNNCSAVSYGGRTYINMIRSIRSAELERRFFSRLVELGVPVDIETNQRR